MACKYRKKVLFTRPERKKIKGEVGRNEGSFSLFHYFTFYFTNFSLPLPSNFKVRVMANHQATKKDVRQSAKRRDRNRYYGKTTRNAIRDLKTLNGKEAADKLPDVISQVDKLAKRGVIHKNKANNIKSKLAKAAKKA